MDDFKPSAFTPFLRRFTDERTRDLHDTKELYYRVQGLHQASRFSKEDALFDFGAEIYGNLCDVIPDSARNTFAKTLDALLALERCIFQFPQIDFRTPLTLKEGSDLRHFLRAKEYFHTHEQKVTRLLKDGLRQTFNYIAEMLPKTFDPSPFTIPLIYALPDPKSVLDRTIGQFSQDQFKDAGLFVELFRTFYLNACKESGIADPYEPKKPLKMPSENNASLDVIVKAYFKGTPFLEFFHAPIPLKFTYEDRFSHMHVVGGTNAGKTQLLQNLILNDLLSEDPPALIIVDSQGDLIHKLSHLAVFDPTDGPLAKRLVMISPKDIEHPPALNIFDLNRERLGTYDNVRKEQVIAGVIETFDYLFEGLLGADLTAKQGVFFRFVARLMLALPETMGRSATILDIINLMEDSEPYREAIKSLPDIQRKFFERDFVSKTFTQTKEQIRYRLNAILENPTLARLFTSPYTKLDLFNCLNNKSIVLVDTAKDFLKGSSAHFGRIFISLVLQAVLERAVISEDERKPAFLIVDEAAAYFDSNIDDLLTQARKYKVGCVFAHQFLDQCTSSLRSSLAANTTIKMAGSVSMSDARALAPDLRTTADVILSQPKLHFAAHIRNVTPQAVSIPVPVGVLERQPKLSQEAYEYLVDFNRLRVSIEERDQGEGFAMRPDHEPRRGPRYRNSELDEDGTATSKDW